MWDIDESPEREEKQLSYKGVTGTEKLGSAKIEHPVTMTAFSGHCEMHKVEADVSDVTLSNALWGQYYFPGEFRNRWIRN
jgi:hypothetical protein